jgi:hypothetical protein
MRARVRAALAELGREDLDPRRRCARSARALDSWSRWRAR